MGGGSEPHKPVHEPTTDSQFGEDETGDGAVLAAPRHRPELDEGGLSADPQRRCSRHRRHQGDGLRGEPGGQSAGPPRPHQVRPLPSAAGSPRVYPEGGRLATAARYPDVRRQGRAARRSDGAGSGFIGWWKSTYASISTRYRIPPFERSSTKESRMASSAG